MHDLDKTKINLNSEKIQNSIMITPATSSVKRLFDSLRNKASSSKKYKMNDNKPVEDDQYNELHKHIIKLLTGIKYFTSAYSVECLKNISKTIIEKLSANETITTQSNDENATFYDVWPIECESDLNHQEECLKDVT